MNIYSMRAETLSGDPYEFTVLDAPIIMGENKFVLVNRKFSPILKFDTITLGSGVGVYVGDVLRDVDGSEWYVAYGRGFYAVHMTKHVKRKLYEFDVLNPVRRLQPEEYEIYHVRKPKLKFKYQGEVFTINDIIGKLNDVIIIRQLSAKVPSSEIQQFTNFMYNKKHIYLGDQYKGMPVVLCYGRVCVQNEFGAYDIASNEYIIKNRRNY